MNPLNWDRKLKIALVILMAIGAVVGFVTGYIVYGAARGGSGGISFNYWANHPFRYGGVWWASIGALIGAGLLYVRILTERDGSN